MTQIFAHRGSSGTHPENTMAAFREVAKVGVEGIEIDVNMTKDNEIVVIHDQTVNRTTNGEGRVKDLTLKDIKKLDAGSWFSEEFSEERVPVLKEVLELIKGTKLLLNIELKNVGVDYPGIEERMIQEIADFGLDSQVIISSFNHYALKKVRELNPKLECAILYLEMLYEPWDYAKRIGSTALHPHAPKTDAELIRGALNNDYPVRVYTVNKEIDIRKFLEWGCSVITDYPALALKVRKDINSP